MPANVIPWIQINDPFDRVTREPELPGLPGIVHATVGAELFGFNSLIVTTHPQWYIDWGFLPGRLSNLLPLDANFRVIYGMTPPVAHDEQTGKWSGSPNSLWDVEGWQKTMIPAIQTLFDNDQHTILLDLEGPFRKGDYTVFSCDVFEVVKMLSDFDDIEFWFNLPRVMPNTDSLPYRRYFTKIFVQIFSKIPNAKFLDASVAYKEHDDQGRTDMISIVGPDRLIDRIMVGDVEVGGKHYFPLAEAKAELEKREGTQVLWTGQEHFVRIARAWNE